MNLDQLMTFIDKLTPQQAGGYLSGQTPFPYQGVPNELWAPRMMAAAHRKMAAGGAVKPAGRKLSKSMQDVLLKRFAGGGDVQRFNDGTPDSGVRRSKYGYVIAYDANGKQIGIRKETDPPLPNEATTKPAGMYAASDAAQPSSFTSPEERQKYMEGKNKALMTPINMARDAVGGLTDLIGMNTKPWKPNMAALNAAIDKGAIPPMPPEVKAEQEAFRKANPVGTPLSTLAQAASVQATAPVQAAQPQPKMEVPALDTEGVLTALNRRATPKTAQENAAGITSMLPASRAAERLKALQDQQAALEGDRKRDMWLGLLQAAGQSMAEGNRSFLGALGSTAAGGAKNVSAAEKEYRGRKGELAKQKMGIEDTADALAREIAFKGIDMTNQQERDAVEVELKKYGLKKDQVDLVFKKAKDLREESELRSQNDARAAQAERDRAAAKAAGTGGMTAYQLAQIRDKAKDNMQKDKAYQLAMARGDQAQMDQLVQAEEQRLLAQTGVSGTMQAAPQSAIRDLNKWSVK